MYGPPAALVRGEGGLEGDLLERVVGLDDAKTSFVMLGPPDGQATIELIKFHRPAGGRGVRHDPANALGLRHIAFIVEDIDAGIARLEEHGGEAFSAVQRFEGSYKLCYVRGPEGIIIELAEELA